MKSQTKATSLEHALGAARRHKGAHSFALHYREGSARQLLSFSFKTEAGMAVACFMENGRVTLARDLTTEAIAMLAKADDLEISKQNALQFEEQEFIRTQT